MDILLPFEAFDEHKITIEPSKKLKCIQTNIQRFICSLQYKDPIYTLSPFCILTPFAKVHTWDFASGKLELDLTNGSIFQSKYNAFQTAIRSLVEKEYTLHSYFHPMMFGQILTVYLYTNMDSLKQRDRDTWIYTNHTWTTTLQESSFKKGQSIRLGIQFQGVCFLRDLVKHDLKYRLQHHIKTIYLS